MKRLSTAIVLLRFITVAAGGNTIRGVGKDAKKADEKIEDVAKKN